MRHKKVVFLLEAHLEIIHICQAFESFIVYCSFCASYSVKLLLIFYNLFRTGELICLAVELSWRFATEGVCMRGGPHVAKADNE